MKPELIALCGLAFSGKSTIARRVAAETGAELISYDLLNAARGFDGGTVMDDSEWEKTGLKAASMAHAALASGRSVVVDDTFSHRFLRQRFAAVAAAAGASFVLLFVDTPLAVIETRIAENARTKARPHIAPDVFAHHHARFEFPRDDERPVRLASAAALDLWLAGRGGASVRA
ncbi:MAG: ATP-binding protein [Rhodospirillales bacterium]|nr:ATP-binding protein [Rhodospirillales bacterium]